MGAREFRHRGFLATISLRAPNDDCDHDADAASNENYGQADDPGAFAHAFVFT
jgi:hypothetical protein